jgi:hypothetical protein
LPDGKYRVAAKDACVDIRFRRRGFAMDRFSTRLAASLISDRHREARSDLRPVGAGAGGTAARRFRAAAGRAFAIAIAVVLLAAGSGIASAGQADIAAVRAATARFHDLDAALAAGYIQFYRCTEQPGVGTMGQHYANLGLVAGDPAIDPSQPEVLVYEPRQDGDGYRLVAVEYVTIQALWEAENGPTTPTVLGQRLSLVAAGNRYGMPPFFQRHVWLWEPNPNGIYADWNPNVSCRGNGDLGG